MKQVSLPTMKSSQACHIELSRNVRQAVVSKASTKLSLTLGFHVNAAPYETHQYSKPLLNSRMESTILNFPFSILNSQFSIQIPLGLFPLKVLSATTANAVFIGTCSGLY